MNLISVTKLKLLLLLSIIFSYSAFSQSQNIDLDSTENETTDVISNQKSVAYTFGFFQPNTNSNSYIGQSTRGKISYKLGAQVFVYKNFFIGGYIGSTVLDVTDTSLIGSYEKSRTSDRYLQIGYELPINSSLRFAASIAPIGSARYKNIINSSTNSRQIDNANIIMFEAYLSYKVFEIISLYIEYSFRNDSTKIKTASQIQDNFKNIQYHNIGFGIKIYLGDKDAISSL